MERKRVLVVGGSGYLGQHLLAALAAGGEVDIAFTHHRDTPPQPLLHALPGLRAFRVDLRSGDGLRAVSESFGQLRQVAAAAIGGGVVAVDGADAGRGRCLEGSIDTEKYLSFGSDRGHADWVVKKLRHANLMPHVIVNCAAISVPRQCETDPAAAMATNVPSSLVTWLLSFGNDNTLLIHLSTDQVYEGVKSFYKEDDETLPVNMYGKSKVAAEKFIIEQCSNYAILRSSIIYGPQTISPVAKSLPIQWMDSVLSQGQQVQFFNDEFRCPVYVKDMVDVVLSLTKSWLADGKAVQVLLNVGGPDRVSRLQMAESVADVRGYSHSIIKSVSASSVDRGVASPPDISMDITKLTQMLGIKPISFQDGVRATLAAEATILLGEASTNFAENCGSIKTVSGPSATSLMQVKSKTDINEGLNSYACSC
uniref:RmlD-like substrate binding domain-containing protein n=1 Tax=Oryza rufipogon TaxID=4529 RepID=A0A0E0NN55_ORYRU